MQQPAFTRLTIDARATAHMALACALLRDKRTILAPLPWHKLQVAAVWAAYGTNGCSEHCRTGAAV